MIERLQQRRGEDGFTLIELLVVIAILGILAGIVVFAVGGIGDKGAESACRTDTRILRTAEEAFSTQNNGAYASQTTGDVAGDLVPDFLATPPKYHTVAATLATPGTPSSYVISVADSKCGTVGAPVDGTTNK